jgi:hypothetical protein
MSEQKFDFQNIDLKLYLALHNICKGYLSLCEDTGGVMDSPTKEYVDAQLALAEFEQSFGPLPDWAIARNWDYSLVVGAQLCTRDGRRTGNAFIIRVGEALEHKTPLYEVMSDMGRHFTMNETEIHEQFWIGEWIMDVEEAAKCRKS